MSYAQPSPPTIHTLRRMRWSSTLRRSSTAGPSSPSSRRCELGDPLALRAQLRLPQLRRLRGSRPRARRPPRRAARRGGGGPARCGGRRPAAARARTRRCPRTASSTTPGRARRRRPSTAWSAGCRRRSTSSRSRWRSSAGRRTAARAASGTGVSPQPAQAPENSNSGSRNCVPRTVPKSTRERSFAGSCSKNAMFSRSAATSGSRASRLIALCTGSPPADTGHASTHSPQPVQSSTYTCSV